MAEFKTPVKAHRVTKEDETIVIPPSPFLSRLGYGTGVSVLQLVRSPCGGQIRSPWAVKMINKKVKQRREYKDRLLVETEILKRISHPNIVGFRACGNSGNPFLGMEKCDISLGDMIEHRIEEEGEPFLPKQILKVAEDISKALDYLHTNMKLLHGDMKSYNILLKGDFVVCKLCDFGVTLPLDENGIFDKEKAGKKAVYYGTEAWSAPEVIHGGQLSNKTDIFPLGLVFWEMMSLMPPHSQQDDTLEDSHLSLDESLEDMIYSRYGTRPPVPDHIAPRQYAAPLSLFHSCTEVSPSARPTAAHLASCATLMMTEIADSALL